MINYIAVVALSFAICYLMGSVMYGVVISKLVAHDDVRNHGSGNAGATNVIRTVGLVPGIITFLLDVLKCVAALLLCRYLLLEPVYASNKDITEFLAPQYMIYLCGIMCVLGHTFPVFFKFRGGKAAATSLGVLLCINWEAGLVVFATFLVVLALTGIVSIGSMVGAIEFVIVTYFLNAGAGAALQWYATLLSALIAIIVIVRHKENIIRLHNGTEKILKFKK